MLDSSERFSAGRSGACERIAELASAGEIMLSVREGSVEQHTAFRAAFVARSNRVVVQRENARHRVPGACDDLEGAWA